MRPGEIYPSKNAQLLAPCHAIASMDQGINTRVLRRRFSVEPSDHAITGTLCALPDGLQIAVAVTPKGGKQKLTATETYNALFFQAMYEKKLARQIVAYLRNHPFSGDTLEGVSRWWLKQQRLTESVSEVHQALVRLGNEGLIYERATPDGRTLFFARTHAEEFDVVENGNGFEEGEVH